MRWQRSESGDVGECEASAKRAGWGATSPEPHTSSLTNSVRAVSRARKRLRAPQKAWRARGLPFHFTAPLCSNVYVRRARPPFARRAARVRPSRAVSAFSALVLGGWAQARPAAGVRAAGSIGETNALAISGQSSSDLSLLAGAMGDPFTNSRSRTPAWGPVPALDDGPDAAGPASARGPRRAGSPPIPASTGAAARERLQYVELARARRPKPREK